MYISIYVNMYVVCVYIYSDIDNSINSNLKYIYIYIIYKLKCVFGFFTHFVRFAIKFGASFQGFSSGFDRSARAADRRCCNSSVSWEYRGYDMTCSCQADNKWWNGVEMVVKLQVDMVDMVRETMRRFFLHSSLHKFMLTRRFLSLLHNNLFWLGARSSWPQSKQKFSTHRNFKSWRTYEKLPF